MAETVNHLCQRLQTLPGIQQELRRVYAEARMGKLDTADASKLTQMLHVQVGAARTEVEMQALLQAQQGGGAIEISFSREVRKIFSRVIDEQNSNVPVLPASASD